MAQISEARLLRLDVSGICNFDCAFCFWRGDADPATRTLTLSSEAYGSLAHAAVHSGCEAVHLTGGEPLALGRRRVCAIVRAICGVDGLRHFYITTNGSLLDSDYCRRLYDAGLRWLTVSIGAETEDKYRAWARPANPRVGLGSVLSRIECAVRTGIDVRVHVPLTTPGVSTYEDLMSLVAQVEHVGVREVGFFKLNKTRGNSAAFGQLHGSGLHAGIVERFDRDSRWLASTRNGYRLYMNGPMSCDPLLPLLDPDLRPVCQRAQSDCGEHCQGTYSAYLRTSATGARFRACHREFDDRRNEFAIPESLLDSGDVAGLAAILARVWSWTRTVSA